MRACVECVYPLRVRGDFAVAGCHSWDNSSPLLS